MVGHQRVVAKQHDGACCLEKCVIDQLPNRVDHSGPNRYVDDRFQPNGKVFHDPILSIAVCWVQERPSPHRLKQTWERMEKRYRSKGLNEENAVVFVASEDSRVGID